MDRTLFVLEYIQFASIYFLNIIMFDIILCLHRLMMKIHFLNQGQEYSIILLSLLVFLWVYFYDLDILLIFQIKVQVFNWFFLESFLIFPLIILNFGYELYMWKLLFFFHLLINLINHNYDYKSSEKMDPHNNQIFCKQYQF